MKVIFGGLWALKNTLAIMNRRKLQNTQKITLTGKCLSTAPRRATKVPKVSF